MIPRRLVSALTSALAEAPAVALLGPRQVGKTDPANCKLDEPLSSEPQLADGLTHAIA
jgi:predicted AAA+ superfamily ATPase